MAPDATTPFMTGFCATEDLVTILPLCRVLVDGLSNFWMRSNADKQELISLWSTSDKSLPRESMQSVEIVGCRNVLKSKALELDAGGGDIVVASAIPTAAAPVDVGNRELEKAAGAVAVQGIAGKLPGVAEKAGLGWLEERNGRARAEANTARVALDATAPVEKDGQPDRGLLEIPPVPGFDVPAADAAGTNEANGF
jgi:hypothetical protein